MILSILHFQFWALLPFGVPIFLSDIFCIATEKLSIIIHPMPFCFFTKRILVIKVLFFFFFFFFFFFSEQIIPQNENKNN
jgi:hypothetical protein